MSIRKSSEMKMQLNIEESVGLLLLVVLKLLLMLYFAHGKLLNLKSKLQNKVLSLSNWDLL
jgi:hypothetical protein